MIDHMPSPPPVSSLTMPESAQEAGKPQALAWRFPLGRHDLVGSLLAHAFELGTYLGSILARESLAVEQHELCNLIVIHKI